jgi:uncharacterized protein YndB with AHSA1/START domain
MDAQEVRDVKPITFSCEASIASPPEEIAEQILDLSRWPEFRGYGRMPGIKAAEFEARTPEVIGTRIRVTDTDGSSHVEEVVEWEPGRRLRLHMGEFSPPLSRLAVGFDEMFEFERTGGQTRVVRRFELHPMGTATRPLLWLISTLLSRAIARHHHQMREDAARLAHDVAGQSAPSREVGP